LLISFGIYLNDSPLKEGGRQLGIYSPQLCCVSIFRIGGKKTPGLAENRKAQKERTALAAKHPRTEEISRENRVRLHTAWTQGLEAPALAQEGGERGPRQQLPGYASRCVYSVFACAPHSKLERLTIWVGSCRQKGVEYDC